MDDCPDDLPVVMPFTLDKLGVTFSTSFCLGSQADLLGTGLAS